ncbi:MAG TPA: ammonia channel protein, partial [Actinomycetota bacterium]|nr:ammonia channel protein [Actinomycetota bacterium]
QLWSQLIAVVAVLVFSFLATVLIGFTLHKTMGLRIDPDDEIAGIDLTTHAESAYELQESGSGGKFAGVGQATVKKEGVSV